MRTSEILKQSRASVLRMREMDEDLEVMRSRVGGQGTGFGTSIDHNVILDVFRNLDEYITASSADTPEGRERIREYEECRRDVLAAETLIAGAEQLIERHSVDQGIDRATAHRNANDMCYVVRAYYVEACSMSELCRRTGYDGRVNRAMLDISLRWFDSNGIAHLKAEIEHDYRTRDQLRREYCRGDGE